MRAAWSVGWGAVFGLLAACGPEAEAPAPVLLGDERSFVLAHAISPLPDRAPADPAELTRLLAEGWGETRAGPGAPATVLTLDGEVPPAPAGTPQLWLRFAHLADAQLTDDESPGRVTALDAMTVTSAAYRPQEAWGCLIFDAAVRTLNRVHARTPVELVVMGGDNVDNAQDNELEWFQAIAGGAPRVHCDSGDDDDPSPGTRDDPKDPLAAEGLAMRWLWVTGNHDALAQGNFVVDEARAAAHVGTMSPLGTRDWRRPGAPTTEGPVPADARRRPLTRAALLARVAADGDGHGLSGAAPGERAFYAADTAARAVRLIALDTAAETGGAGGVLRRADMEARVRPLLDAAARDGVRAIVVSHHAAGSLGDGSGFAGQAQPDTVAPDELRALLGRYDNVLMHLAAHSHRFHAAVSRPDGGHPYFEVQTASLIDWPGALHVIEVWGYEDGTVRIRARPLDYDAGDDPRLAEARRRTALDFTTGWADVRSDEGGVLDLWAR